MMRCILTGIVPEGDSDDEIEAHENHTLEPITLPICDCIVDNEHGEEEHDALKGVEEHRQRLAHDPREYNGERNDEECDLL